MTIISKTTHHSKEKTGFSNTTSEALTSPIGADIWHPNIINGMMASQFVNFDNINMTEM